MQVTENGRQSRLEKNLRLLRVATENDLLRIVDQWERVSYTSIISDPEWHWQKLDESNLCKLITSGEIRALPNGFAVLRGSSDSSVTLHALAGDEDAMHELAFAARVEAGNRGAERVEALIIDDSAVNRALTRAGYEREGGIFTYELTLQ